MRTDAPTDFRPDVFYDGVYLFQKWDIFPGVQVGGQKPVTAVLDKLQLPNRLDGLRVLEIAPWNGFFSFECIRRGAREVVALGPDDPDATGFNKTVKLLEIENITYVRESVYNIPQLDLGRFDVVLFLGLIYHLRHPLLALDIIYDCCDKWLFIDSPTVDDIRLLLLTDREKADLEPSWSRIQNVPLMYFSHADEVRAQRDPFNWFMPNERALRDLVGSSGFEVEVFHAEPLWTFSRARKTKRLFEPGLEGFNPSAFKMPG